MNKTINQTTYGTTPIDWSQHRDELYASVGHVRLRIRVAKEPGSEGHVYSSTLALLTASGWSVVKHEVHHDEDMAIHLAKDAADMLYGLPAICDDPWVKLNEKSCLYARLDGRFMLEMQCSSYFDMSHGVSLYVFNDQNHWRYVYSIAAYGDRERLDSEVREARLTEATEKMKQFAAIMFLNRLTSPV